MATSDDKDEKLKDAEAGDAEVSSSDAIVRASDESIEATGAETLAIDAGGSDGDEGETAITLGSERYVHAAFFIAGILTAYLASKTLALCWNELASWPAAVRAVPQLVTLTEEQRDSYALMAGAAIGTLTVVQAYRKENVRTWANEVAAELSKVTWPNREAVLNGTVVVVVASALATVYVALLDRIWSFLTTLVYGA
jgi:preprotein translocase subunit SecE